MQIEIRIGDTTKNKRIEYTNIYYDDIIKTKEDMYKFLQKHKDCIIEKVDIHLLITLATGILGYITVNKVKNHTPIFDPSVYRVFEVSENKKEKAIQEKDGTIGVSYFDNLTKELLKDFYNYLNYY